MLAVFQDMNTFPVEMHCNFSELKKENHKVTYNYSTVYRWSTGQLVAGVSRKLIHQDSQTGNGC